MLSSKVSDTLMILNELRLGDGSWAFISLSFVSRDPAQKIDYLLRNNKNFLRIYAMHGSVRLEKSLQLNDYDFSVDTTTKVIFGRDGGKSPFENLKDGWCTYFGDLIFVQNQYDWRRYCCTIGDLVDMYDLAFIG